MRGTCLPHVCTQQKAAPKAEFVSHLAPNQMTLPDVDPKYYDQVPYEYRVLIITAYL